MKINETLRATTDGNTQVKLIFEYLDHHGELAAQSDIQFEHMIIVMYTVIFDFHKLF